MLSDLRFAVRRLGRSPGFSVTVVLLIALTLGANACLFGVLYGLVYKPLPFPAAERVVTFKARLANMQFDVGLPVPYLQTIAANSRTLESAAGWRSRDLAAGKGDGAVLHVADVEPGVFGLLGARPLLGRLLGEEDVRTKAANAVISSELWQSRFDGAADAVGKTLRVADGDYRIVGVLPPHFGFPNARTALWLPLAFSESERSAAQAGSFGDLNALARLRPGADFAAANGELASLSRSLDGLKNIVDLIGFRVEAMPLRNLWIGERRHALELMLLAVVFVLIVAAANLCNLSIARMLARRQEFAILDALGAGTWRRLRQVFGEALLLCIAGAAAGLALIPAGIELLRRFDLVPTDTPQPLGIDGATLLFAAALALLLALALSASVLPLQHRAAQSIGSGGRHTAGRGAQRARLALIVTQIALTASLLFAIGLLLRSSRQLLAEDVGFERDHVAITEIADLPKRQPGGPDAAASERARSILRTLVKRTRALPGVSAVGLSSVAPFGWSMSIGNFSLPGDARDAATQPTANRAYINAEFFAALGATIARGRPFTPEEARSRARVAIVDTQFVKQVFGDTDPLGQRFTMSADDDRQQRELTIVGVAPTVKLQTLDEKAERPMVYEPDELPLNSMLLIRGNAAPGSWAAPINAIVHELAPDARLRDVVPIGERIAETLRDRERLNTLLELLGALALTLAAIGLYAVLAYSVRMRAPEFGVRMALGATGRRVLHSVLLHGAALIAIGLLLAVPLAFALGRLLTSRLYHVGTFDAPTLAAVAALLGAVSLAACWLPARRAARVDPIQALRSP